LTESKNVQLFCFFLGCLHLTIAHGWRLILKFPAISAYAELGWIFILWSAFLKANEMILAMPLPDFVVYLFCYGIFLVIMNIFWEARDKNILKFIGQIFVNFVISFFSVISAFTDLVSYIRLFAVGLAGAAVADAFNQMAIQVGFNNFTAGLITSFILVVGHVFNIILSGFGVLVHGLRLNVLEFSGHMGLEWTGIKYDPFRKA
jgi:V/A-type H+-transporting ATPase subunit I